MAAPVELNHEAHMRRAIELSEKAGVIDKTGGVFGAVIVDKTTGEVVSEGYNQVVSQCDPTWHGEVHAIRLACAKRKSPHLPGCIIYTSAQPCPMCYTACMWARLEHVYYGAKYEDVMEHGKFEDADFMGELHKPEAEREVVCEELMREEAVVVWRKYAALTDVVHY